LIGRVRATIPERRRSLGLSLRELARASRVSRATVTRIERSSGRVDPALVVNVSKALTELELHVPPPVLDEDLAEVAERLAMDLADGSAWLRQPLGIPRGREEVTTNDD
jgi:transcriptional regulator with XRE-family HTH domain